MYCPRCQVYVPTYLKSYPGPNHVLHGLLTFFLCGLWLPVWIIVALSDSGVRQGVHCAHCHGKLG